MMRLVLLAVALAAAPAAQTELLSSADGLAISATRSATFDSRVASDRLYSSAVSGELMIGALYLGAGAGWSGTRDAVVALTVGGYAERDAERGIAALVGVTYQTGGGVNLLAPSVSLSRRVVRAGAWELAPQGSVGMLFDLGSDTGREVGGPFGSGGLALSAGTPRGRFVVSPAVTVLPTAEFGVFSVGVTGGFALGL